MLTALEKSLEMREKDVDKKLKAMLPELGNEMSETA